MVDGPVHARAESPDPSRPGADCARQLEAALHACALADRSDTGRILATGRDLLDLLHRLGTADVRSLAPGEGRGTVLTSPKGRIVERLFVHRVAQGSTLLIGGSGSAERIRAHIDRFTFAERTGLSDVTLRYQHWALVGPHARQAASRAGMPVPPPLGSVALDPGSDDTWVLGEDGFSAEGLSVVAPRGADPGLERRLEETVAAAGGTRVGAGALEAWRLLRGFGGPAEYGEDHNPLEAGLSDHVSFTKGCYVGQEVVARLRTYDKVSRALVGLVLPSDAAVPERGTALYLGARAAGAVTSAAVPPGRRAPVALAYVKRWASEPGTRLGVGAPGSSIEAEVRTLPIDTTP